MTYNEVATMYQEGIARALPKYLYENYSNKVISNTGGAKIYPAAKFRIIKTGTNIDLDIREIGTIELYDIVTVNKYKGDEDTTLSMVNGLPIFTSEAHYLVNLSETPNEALVKEIIRLVYFILAGDMSSSYSLVSKISKETKNIHNEFMDTTPKFNNRELQNTSISAWSL